jgi:putative membrane protein insertion efficiency factor
MCSGGPGEDDLPDRGSRPPSVQARVVLALLRAYKVLISPLFTGSCRFTPSCSEYMAEAVVRHGLLRGGWLGVVRLSRCRPFGGHGVDPVPDECGGPVGGRSRPERFV